MPRLMASTTTSRETGVTYRDRNYNSYSGSVVIPESVTYNGKTYSVMSIGGMAFYGCSDLTSVTIPESVTSIGSSAFDGCSGLTSITIPNRVTYIGDYAFAGCSGLTSIAIPKSVTSIGDKPFINCSSLTSIDVDSGNAVYDSRNNCNAIIKTSTNTLISGCKNTIIPNSVTSIGFNAFWGCSSLTSITIPECVTNIGQGAFAGCSGLISITIPEGVTSIGDNAFLQCGSLASIAIPNSVTSIGKFAFQNCKSLTSLTIPSGLKVINNYTFSFCTSLKTITIPNSIRLIDSSAFWNCTSLTDVYCMVKNAPATNSGVFSDCPIGAATLHVPASSIESYRTTAPWSSFKSIVGISEYTLSYMLDGNEYKSYSICEGENITPEPAPTKEGYTFSGWSGLPTTMPDHDVVVTGSFTVNSYTLTYKVDGNVYKTFSVKYGSTLTPIAEPTKVGHTFSGWSGLPATMPAHNVTVTGSFTVNLYTLTYKVDDEVYKTFSVEYGTAITPIVAPIKEGHTFSGWSEIPATMPAHDVVVTGSFAANSYTLTYKVDGTVYKTYSITYRTAITPEPAPTKEGYTFSGWSEIPATMPAHDVTVTGSFTINSYTLTYKVNGQVYKTSTFVYGSTITPEHEPTREGYTFSGWSEIPETMPAHDVTVTGNFIPNRYLLTYIIDGEVYKTFSVVYGSALTPEPSPKKKGMTFSGWGEIPETMPAFDLTFSGTYSWSKETVSNIIYQVADTLNNYVSVIGNNNISGSAEILPSIKFGGDTYAVNTIGADAFRNRNNLTSIAIPKSVTSIGSDAFYGCYNISFYVNRGSYALFYVWNNYNTDPYEIGTDTRLSRPSVSAVSTTQTTIRSVYTELLSQAMGST